MDELIIGEVYKVIKELTRGHSSRICEGMSLKDGKVFAVKLQSSDKNDSVLRQATILRNIQQKYHIIVDYGIPYCYAAGQQANNNYLFIDLLATDLSQLLKKCKGIFSIKTFLMLADQMLKRLQFIHSQEYIHRAISLKKFMMGLGTNNKRLYLCGFGEGKHYIKNGVHITYKQGKKAKGNLSYVSINRHLGIEASRRDDLESLAYCWVKMLYGKLPWEDQKDSQKVLSKKIQNSGSVILASFPKQLRDAYDYCRGLGFDESPNYQYLRNTILSLFSTYKQEYDYDYDWQQGQFGVKEKGG